VFSVYISPTFFYNIICATIRLRVVTHELLHRSSSTGVLTQEIQEFLRKISYTGIVIQELLQEFLHRNSLPGEPLVSANSYATTTSIFHFF